MLINNLSQIIIMTIDMKMRYAMFGLAAASLLLATFGFHLNPLAIAGGLGHD